MCSAPRIPHYNHREDWPLTKRYGFNGANGLNGELPKKKTWWWKTRVRAPSAPGSIHSIGLIRDPQLSFDPHNNLRAATPSKLSQITNA